MQDVPELTGLDLLGEWKRLMDGVMANATSIAGRSDIPRQLLEPMQRQVELVQDIIERERRVQQEIAARALAPVEAVFELLEGTGLMLRRQAEALEAAGKALQDTAG